MNLDDTMPQRVGYGLLHHQGEWYPVSCIASATALGDSEDENMTNEKFEIRKGEKKEVRMNVTDVTYAPRKSLKKFMMGCTSGMSLQGITKAPKGSRSTQAAQM